MEEEEEEKKKVNFNKHIFFHTSKIISREDEGKNTNGDFPILATIPDVPLTQLSKSHRWIYFQG